MSYPLIPNIFQDGFGFTNFKLLYLLISFKLSTVFAIKELNLVIFCTELNRIGHSLNKMDKSNISSLIPLLSGSTAGLCTDLTLFPIDTIKTRLQSSQHGIHRTTGSLRLFAGFPAVLFGSAPGAAMFFLTYETTKMNCSQFGIPSAASSIVAACVAEVASCIIRVPCEVIKQRAQNQPEQRILKIFSTAVKTEGVRGLYRGYRSTIFREIPFSFIQYPVWEQFKHWILQWNNRVYTVDHELRAWQSCLCGCLAGCIAGTITTPLDVAKTRIMLAEPHSSLASGHVFNALQTVFRENGIRGLFAGLIPRVTFLSIGGAIFLGIYDISGRFWKKFYN